MAIPDSLPFEHAAIIPDAVSAPWAAITAPSGIRPAQAAGVWGVGGLGVHAVQPLRMVGAAPIIAVDPIGAARERATSFGADILLDSADPDLRQRALDATGGRGLAVAFDFVGVPAVSAQIAGCVSAHGKIVIIGVSHQPLSLDIYGVVVRQLQVIGHYASEPEHVLDLVRLAARGRLELSRSVSAVLPLDDAAAAVDRLRRKEGNPIRLVLRP